MRENGNADPTPSGAMARRKNTAPKTARRRDAVVSRNKRSAMASCATAIGSSIQIVCSRNQPSMNARYHTLGVRFPNSW
jgi:hypothetical protein